MKHDENDLNSTFDPGTEVELDPSGELDAVLDDLESLLKNGEVIGVLTARGINSSLALTAASGLRAYLKGNKREATEDLSTAAEEIRSRLTASDGVLDGGDPQTPATGVRRA